MSFHGVVFETVDLPLSKDKLKQYDAAVQFWEEFKQQFDSDLKHNADRLESEALVKRTSASTPANQMSSLRKALSVKRRLFWSTQQRYKFEA